MSTRDVVLRGQGFEKGKAIEVEFVKAADLTKTKRFDGILAGCDVDIYQRVTLTVNSSNPVPGW